MHVPLPECLMQDGRARRRQNFAHRSQHSTFRGPQSCACPKLNVQKSTAVRGFDAPRNSHRRVIVNHRSPSS